MTLGQKLVLVACATFALVRGNVETPTCWRGTICSGPVQPAFPGPWQTDIFAPPIRSVRPKKILSLSDGKVISQFPGPASLRGNGSALVFDFGIEVGGIIAVNYTATGPASLGLAFSEAKNWIGEWSDTSNGKFKGPDGALYANITASGKGRYVMPDKVMRGGFRYLTLFLETTDNSTLSINDIKTEISFQPTWSHLQSYQGYFQSSDDLLNKIWYAGAYTLQTNTVPTNTGRQVPTLKYGWANNATLGPGHTIIVDGAKRDRAVWPGDMGVAVPAVFVSTGDLESVKNALQVMYNYQNKDGSLPEAGPPLLQQSSDTYHMWTMIGTHTYVLFTNDTDFLTQNWPKYEKAMDYIYSKVGDSGLLNVTGQRDWARWQTTGNSSEANMILYETLKTAAELVSWVGPVLANPNLKSRYLHRAKLLKSAINQYQFDVSHGAYRDNATSTTLYPQDANSMAILFNVTTTPYITTEVSDRLKEYWTDIGPASPELPNNISPFITSFELQAHFSIGKTGRALDLLRRTWGWYVNHPNGTGSTLIEGYRTDGTFGYRSERGYGNDPSYVSHSHGWSAGPTSALTNYIAGLTVTGRSGSKWSIAPQLGDLQYAEAGFTTSLGRFRVAWQRIDAAPSSSPNGTTIPPTFRDFAGYDVQIDTPLSTEGEIILPFLEEGVEPSVSTYESSGAGSADFKFVGDGKGRLKSPVSGGRKQFVVRQVFEGEAGEGTAPPVSRMRYVGTKRNLFVRDWGL
ncbi:putative metabolite transport protein [Venturia nashicola]|uniref:Putative metabolite transport protein n=1 Tax=Venturia nashicola TaxID=86259 RepID=A0A4Z1PDF0_9PEZI|nr:putative metabolite transport protein [Venturia nashicola]TLD32333.1 putative metabolite transport protein [Venturia nashicola]